MLVTCCWTEALASKYIILSLPLTHHSLTLRLVDIANSLVGVPSLHRHHLIEIRRIYVRVRINHWAYNLLLAVPVLYTCVLQYTCTIVYSTGPEYGII